MSEISSPERQQSFSTSTIVPRLVRSFSKGQTTIQPSTSTATANADGSTSTLPSTVSKQKVTAIDRFLKFARKESSKAPDFPPLSWFQEGGSNGTNLAEEPSQSRNTEQNRAEPPTNNAEASTNGTVAEEVEVPEPITLAKKIQDMISTIPSLPATISASSSRFKPAPSLPPEVEADGPPPTPPPPPGVNDSKLLAFLTSSDFMNGSIERGRQSVWSALDHLRPPFGKKPDTTTGTPGPTDDTVLDCIDDNNTVMMYGPLEPDDSSEVEIACSEIVSVNGDGEEIRTPQPRFTPLPSESIEQVFMGADYSAGGKGKEGETDSQSETETFVGTGEASSSAEPAIDRPPVKEYRVWLPSLTKISVQTMWWGFRM